MINSLFKLLGDFIPLTYLVLDGHFGNNNALQMARLVNLHIISKLRYDSALYIPYQNPDSNKRYRRKYGENFLLNESHYRRRSYPEPAPNAQSVSKSWASLPGKTGLLRCLHIRGGIGSEQMEWAIAD